MNCDCTPEERRMHAEIERLRSQPCPYVTGTVTQHCTLTPFTLTDEEREAIERVAIHCADTSCVDTAKTLWGLLERTSR
jgi:hypothetical protein